MSVTFKWRQQLMIDRRVTMVPITCTVVDSWQIQPRYPRGEPTLIIKVLSTGHGVDRTDTGGAHFFHDDFWQAAMHALTPT